MINLKVEERERDNAFRCIRTMMYLYANIQRRHESKIKEV